MLVAMFELLDPVPGSAQCGRERPPGAGAAQREVRFAAIDSLSLGHSQRSAYVA
jgi:hypothetical protein